MRVFILLFAAFRVWAAELTVSGQVSDDRGVALAGATVVSVAAGGSIQGSADTDADGYFQLTVPQAGNYYLVTSCPGFSAVRTAVLVRHDDPTDVRIRLALQPLHTEVTVTAEAGSVTEAGGVPQRTNIIAGAALELRTRTVNTELFREEPGVDVQRTAPAMGGVAIRGLLGRNVAVYIDGVRYTTAAQRGGVSTFWNLMESTNIDSVEVLRGPGTGQYGSDAMGGTVHFVSRMPSPERAFRLEIAPMYFSAAHAFGGNLLTSFQTGRLGGVLNLSARRSNTLRTGKSIDTHAAVTRYLGLPSTVLGDRVGDSALTQYGGMFHVGYSGLTLHYERNQQDGAKRPDELLGGDGNLIADLRNLMLDFGYLRYTRPIRGLHRVTATVSYNAQREERVNQRGSGDPLGKIAHQYERTAVWGGSTHAELIFRRHHAVVGGDAYSEHTRTAAYTFDPMSEATALTRPRIPGGARYVSSGAYLQDVWQLGSVRVSSALRFGGASYRSRAAKSPLLEGARLWPDDSLAATALTGRAGATWRLADSLRLHFNYSRGFRAPNITDLGAAGMQGNGLFEVSFADLAERGAEVGDSASANAVSSGRAVSAVRPEISSSAEAGATFTSSRLRWEVSAFSMKLSDSIVSHTLILPPGAIGQQIGGAIVTRQLESGAVFVTSSPQPVLVRGNLGGTNIAGVEQTLEWRLSRSLLFAESYSYVHARDVRTGLAPAIEGGMPPKTAHLRLSWNSAAGRLYLEWSATAADRQARLSTLALADRRSGASRSRSGIASFFRNGARARGLVAGNVLLPTGETLSQVQTRVLGNMEGAPMFTAVPGFAIHTVRAAYRVSAASNISLELSNLFDKSHRGVSSGTDGPGRALTVRYVHQF